MNNKILSILLIEDSKIDVRSIERHFRSEKLEASIWNVETVGDLETAFDESNWDLVISDHRLPTMSSLDALQLMQSREIDLPFILVSGTIGEQNVVNVLKAGAHDFIPKDDLSRLIPAMERELREWENRRLRKEAENQLEQSNKRLKEAFQTITQTQEYLVRSERLQAIGQMTSGIAHDFNNMLSKMSGVVSILETEYPETSSRLEQLQMLVQEGASVVRRLREYYQIKPEVEDRAHVALTDILPECVELTRPRWCSELAARGIDVSVEANVEEDLPPVLANPFQLREVLTNLIFNSCDAMPEGGRISVTASALQDRVLLRVSDTGTGMDEETKRHCLEAFYTTKGDNGTGLGLSVVHQIVRGMDGRLRVDSEPGKGTTVTLDFPASIAALADRPEETDGRMEMRASHAQGLRIMVVDDEPLITKVVEKILQMEGHNPVSFNSAEEALVAFEQENFDVVISDRSMPQMSGDHLARLIKEKSSGTPFIMASGFGDLMRGTGDLPDGVNLILPKPFSREALREAIESVAFVKPRGAAAAMLAS